MSSDRDIYPYINRKRRVASGDAGKAELERYYRFVPEPAAATAPSTSNQKEHGTWQDRMVQHYHQHLYKEYVLADLRFVTEEKLGLRWRTKQEVAQEKGSKTCGNKHCPSHNNPIDKKLHAQIDKYKAVSDSEAEERHRLALLNYGDDQLDFEVPFSYEEDDESKMELVKLRLCAKCAPLLYISKNSVQPCLAARGVSCDPAQEAKRGDALLSSSSHSVDSSRQHKLPKRKDAKTKRKKYKHKRSDN